MMKRRLQRLYDEGRLSKDGLLFYVEHGFLTEEDYKEITDEDLSKTNASKEG